MLDDHQIILCKPFKRIGSSLYFNYQDYVIICGLPESWESIEDKNFIDTEAEFRVRVLWKRKGINRYTGTIKYV